LVLSYKLQAMDKSSALEYINQMFPTGNETLVEQSYSLYFDYGLELIFVAAVIRTCSSAAD